MTDQITGMTDRRHDRGVASISTPAVKIIVGHGTPNAGIRVTLKCCTALIPGYSSEYAIRTHATGAHPLRQGANDSRPCTTPRQKNNAPCRRKSAAKTHAAGLIRVKNAAWYARADQNPMGREETAEPAIRWPARREQQQTRN
jgi:hypothetical protein